MLPLDYYAPSCKNIFKGFLGLGSLVGGIFLGISDSVGFEFSDLARNSLKFVPAGLAGIIGVYDAIQLNNDPRIDSKKRSILERQGIYGYNQEPVIGCGNGCVALCSPVINAGIVGSMTCGGYLIGKSIGDYVLK